MDNERGVHADISKKYLYRLSYHRKQGTIFDDKRWASRISGKVGSCVVVHPKICLLIHTISVDYRERKRQRQRDRDRDRQTEESVSPWILSVSSTHFTHPTYPPSLETTTETHLDELALVLTLALTLNFVCFLSSYS